MPTINGHYYGQENPRDQLRVILGSVEAWVSLLEDGTTSPERAAKMIQGDLDHAKQLFEDVESLDAWPETA